MTTQTIPKGWTITMLGEVVEILSGSTPSTKDESYWDGTIPWITPKDLSSHQFVFISKGERNITDEGLKNSSAQILKKNTILFSSRAPIGYVAIAGNDLCTNQGFKNIACDERKSHFRFFYYWLIFSKEHIEKISSGSTFAEATTTVVMRSLLVPLPPLPEQRAIAAVLSSLDDKIELLRRNNKTLGNIAQTLFKRWFVEYEFPNEKGKPYKSTGGKMIDSELGEIPVGWETKGLSAIADFLNGLAMQKFPAESESDYLPVVKIRELKSGITEQTDKASRNIDRKYIVNGDILFSWSGSLEVVIWECGKGVLNQHLFKVVLLFLDIRASASF